MNAKSAHNVPPARSPSSSWASLLGSSLTSGAASAVKAAQIPPDSPLEALAGSARYQRVRMVPVDDKCFAYVWARLRCLKTPLSRSDAKSASGGKSGAPDGLVWREVRVPLNMTAESLSVTFSDLIEEGVAMISPFHLHEELTRVKREAEASLERDAWGDAVDSLKNEVQGQLQPHIRPTFSPEVRFAMTRDALVPPVKRAMGKLSGKALAYLGMDSPGAYGKQKDKERDETELDPLAFQKALISFKRQRTLTPEWRPPTVIAFEDPACQRALTRVAQRAESPSGVKDGAKDGKSVERAADASAPRQGEVTLWTADAAPTYALGKRKLRGTSWLTEGFFSHIAPEATKKSAEPDLATGHVRVSHDTEAFPRTLSLERIAELASQALAIAIQDKDQRPFQPKSFEGEHHSFCATVEGLDLFVFVDPTKLKAAMKSPPPGAWIDHTKLKKSIVTAYLSRTSSARQVEIDTIRSAVALMREIRNDHAKKIVAQIRPKDLWSAMGAASALCWLKATRKEAMGLTRNQEAMIDALRRRLSIGETRDLLHHAQIYRETLALLFEAGYRDMLPDVPKGVWTPAS